MRPVTLSEIAELTGATWRTVRARINAAGLQPVQRTRKSDLYASDQALLAVFAAESNADSGEFDSQRERLAAAQAEKVEWENAVRRGQLADMRQVTEAWATMISTCRARLLRLPSSLAPILVGCEAIAIEKAIRTELYSALDELSRWEPAPEQEQGAA